MAAMAPHHPVTLVPEDLPEATLNRSNLESLVEQPSFGLGKGKCEMIQDEQKRFAAFPPPLCPC